MGKKPIALLALLAILSLYSPAFCEPGVKIALSNNHVLPGQTIKLEIITDKKLKKNSIVFSRSKFQLVRGKDKATVTGNRYLGYVGVSRKLTPKRRLLKVFLHFEDDTRYSTQYKIWVEDAKFKKDYITLSPKKKKLSRDYSTLNEENRILKPHFKSIRSKRLFTYPFIKPVEGRMSSPYGRMRIYNGKPSWPHSGMDIAVKKGTPIKAANHGIVTTAASFKVHGNTILLDHGWGIVTVYNHLDSLGVQVGERVKKGQVIGTVGSTGIATGPHLHWGFSVQNIRVNPLFWLDKTFLYD